MEYRKITPDEAPESECIYCGAPTDATYCSTECKKADIL